jgi:NFU1 iron-sulfur cluster scaffold homolog, mitochondrial
VTPVIPIHPQPCAGRPDTLRWVTPAGALPFTGTPATVPTALAALLDDGTLAGIRVEAAAVVTQLGAGRAWSRDGSRVRSALHAALDEPARWTPAGAPDGPDDEPLRAAARTLIDGPVGELARSHGGSVELLGVRDGIVTVRLAGACHGCPAARVTLRQRLENQLRRRCPDLRTVVDAAGSGTDPARVLHQRPGRPELLTISAGRPAPDPGLTRGSPPHTGT